MESSICYSLALFRKTYSIVKLYKCKPHQELDFQVAADCGGLLLENMSQEEIPLRW